MQRPKHPNDHCGVELDAFIGQYGQPANVTGKSQVARRPNNQHRHERFEWQIGPLSEAGSNRVEQKLTFRCSGCGKHTANIYCSSSSALSGRDHLPIAQSHIQYRISTVQRDQRCYQRYRRNQQRQIAMPQIHTGTVTALGRMLKTVTVTVSRYAAEEVTCD